MKYVILRVEDLAPRSSRVAPLLEGAKTVHLQQLAQAGAAGLIGARGDAKTPDRFELHRGLLGLSPDDAEVSAGACYAGSLRVQPAPNQIVWCCELVTQQDGKILDATAGNLSPQEGQALVQALNDQLGSDTRRWVVGQKSHHALLAHDARQPDVRLERIPSPELLVGHAWNRSLPKGALGETLRTLIGEAAKILELHPVNRVRIDLGENPANMAWLWGAARGGGSKTLAQRSGLTGALFSSSFPMQGFAQALGLHWGEGLATFEEPAVQRMAKRIADALGRHDLVYAHLQVASADPVERLCAMERIDHLLIQPLTQRATSKELWRVLVVIDDRTRAAIPFVAIGSGLPQQPIATLAAQNFSESPLAFSDGAALFGWLTRAG